MIRHLYRRIRCGYPFPSPSSITATATPALISSRLAFTLTTNRTHIYQSLDRTRIRGRGYAQEALKTQEEENENGNESRNKGANPAPAPVKTWEKFVRKTYAPRPRPRLYNPTTTTTTSGPVDPVNHANNPGSSAVVPGDSGVTSNQLPQSAGKPVRRNHHHHLPTTSHSHLSIPTNRSSTISDWQESTNPDPRNRNRNRNRNRPASDTTFTVPDSLDSHDISEIHDDNNNDILFDHTPFSYSRTLTTDPLDAYIDAPDHEPGFAAGEYDQVDDLILQQHLHNDAAAAADADADDADNIESYTPAQTDSIKRGIKDVNGRAARGTRDNPLMGDLDPLEVEMMGVDKLAGGEEQVGFVGFFTDEELEALMVAERARGGGSGSGEVMLDSVAVEKGKGLSSSVLKRTPRAKSRPASNTNPHPTALPPPSSTFQPTRYPTPPPPRAAALSLSSTETGARYGTDSTGTPTPSRFQWWARATSRHPESLAEAKSVMVMRKSVGVCRLMSGERWFRPVKAYTEHFIPLIEAEQAHEEKVIRERLANNGVEKLVVEGYCLNELSARREMGTQVGRPTYTFSFGGGGRASAAAGGGGGSGGSRRFAWNRFNPGTCIIISPSGEKADPVKKNQSRGGKGSNSYNTGSVVSKTYGSVKVSFDEPLNPAELSHTWRLDIWTSDIVMRRAKEALAALHYDPIAIDRHGVPNPKLEPLLTVAQAKAEAAVDQELDGGQTTPKKPTMNQFILPGTALRRVLLDDFMPRDPSAPRPAQLNGPGFFADNELIQSWCRRQLVKGREPVEVEGDPELTLNTSQRRAIAMMLSSDISLIQGPPGTGKTRTIIEMLRLLKVHWEVPHPILVSAYTNNAVDNLAEGMSKRGLKVLRYGSRSRIREDLKELTLDWYLERHPDNKELQRLKGLTYNLPKDDVRRAVYRSRLFGLERRMVTDILLSVDVVCATCISSRGRLLEVVDFPVVFIDEASMATEPNAVIPLTKGCQHAALIGDHKQLPPLVISAKAAAGKLQTSLFERLITSGKIPSIMLDTQYRMHPDISAFPSKAFYGSKLKDGTMDNGGNVLAGLEPPQGSVFRNDATGQQRTVTFIHHTKPDFARAKSIVNEGEAAIIYQVVLQLLKENPKLMGSDIGIIAPYAGQISRIQNEIRHNTWRRRQSVNYLGEQRSWELDNIEVHTVDGFEGREKQVILFSTTRSNEGNWIGFLDDWRRMNVGLTRAKSGLIIVGNSHTLENARSNFTTDPEATAGTVYWRQLIRDLREANAIEPHDFESAVPTSPQEDEEISGTNIREEEQEEQTVEPEGATASQKV